jgi:uncharacterized membrane protein
MDKTILAAFVIVILSFAVSIYVQPQLPQQIASHWNAQGQVDGYMSKETGLFLMPLISLGLLILFLLIPKIDPLRKNIEKFRAHYIGLMLLMVSFFFYIHLVTILWNLGVAFNMSLTIIPALSVLFFYLGIVLENARMNWFVGIRTPWTLSNEKVWNKTHKLGGKLFKGSGIVALLGILLPDYFMFFVVGPIILSSIYLVVYSYLEFQKEIKK